jgi:DNA processing protein
MDTKTTCSNEELKYLIALCQQFKYRPSRLRKLLEFYSSPQEAWERLEETKRPNLLERAQEELEFIDKHHIRVDYFKDAHYPYRLKECPDAPILLYSKGKQLDTSLGKFVSIVGTRNATDRGKENTRRLVLDLAASIPDVTIISGLAYGIDIAAHKAALEASIPTIIVTAHGLDRIYPAIHRPVAISALENGGIITEYCSKTEPEPQNFIARNRIVAGLADAVVVVESKEKGGSLITAHMALDYNRDIFAFPGRIHDENSKGCNALIRKQYASLIENADDLIQAMKWEVDNKPIQTEIENLFETLNEKEQTILHILRAQEESIHINELALQIKIPYSEIASTLMMLEFKEWVKSLPGGMYRAIR